MRSNCFQPAVRCSKSIPLGFMFPPTEYFIMGVEWWFNEEECISALNAVAVLSDDYGVAGQKTRQ